MISKHKQEIESRNRDMIIWESEKKFCLVAILQYLIYFIVGILLSCFSWAILLQESFLYIILTIPLTLFFVYEIYKAINLKSAFLTQNGLLLQTRLKGTIFYPYGHFVIGFSLAVGIRYFERISVYGINHKNIEFVFPCGYDSLGIFKNNKDFKQFCTHYTQNALETMNTKEKVMLYKLYRQNIEIIFNEERNHNVFTLDFKPYEEEIKKYFCNELRKTLETMNSKEKVILYKNYKVWFEKTKNLQYNMDCFTSYMEEMESYLREKK
ncbi:hypothetical protein [Helicobacter sp. MIT 05-5294]|uniref:hypothetical protein n=1 Tax=Helicobacter sp. MIT 05-5294 TaxID=1548150 RepID=UPI00051FB026|nr:hypothetical protein [Helicobacter sp. MIT 05-5294]TLD84793.1 hypothetical protein LS69_009885 [Helicobacter sp. MIT 05-5294]